MTGEGNEYWKALFTFITPPLTLAQQEEVDKNARVFIRNHRNLKIDDIIAPIAAIPTQPLTYLTVTQEDRIRYIMEIKTKQLWDQTFYPESSRLLRNLGSRRSLLNAKASYDSIENPRDKKLIKKAGIELMGEDLFA